MSAYATMVRPSFRTLSAETARSTLAKLVDGIRDQRDYEAEQAHVKPRCRSVPRRLQPLVTIRPRARTIPNRRHRTLRRSASSITTRFTSSTAPAMIDGTCDFKECGRSHTTHFLLPVVSAKTSEREQTHGTITDQHHRGESISSDRGCGQRHAARSIYEANIQGSTVPRSEEIWKGIRDRWSQAAGPLAQYAPTIRRSNRRTAGIAF